MWSRKELKANGKAAFQANYWRSVLAGFLLIGIAAAGGSAVGSRAYGSARESGIDVSNLSEEAAAMLGIILLAVIGTIAVVSLFGTLIKIFAWNPLTVGCQRFFLENGRAPADLGELGYGFRNYWESVKTMFLRDLFLFLWGLLFVIPGIVKAYSYRMVPFILAENPDMAGTEAITRSRQMMNGHKWDTFVLDLSFLGWDILSALTSGILGLFYVNPYKCATNAELYRAICTGE